MGRGRAGSGSNNPSSVFVPPMSAAKSMFLLTPASFSIILRPIPVHGSQPLAGHLVVFTGKLSSLGRKEARALVASLGGSTADDVNARTTMVVVGAEGFGAGSKEEKSQKLKRAEELNVRIISENDFCDLAGVPSP